MMIYNIFCKRNVLSFLLLGFIIFSVQAAVNLNLEGIPKVDQDITAEEPQDQVTTITKNNIVKLLSDEQTDVYFRNINRPQMIEKTKIKNKIRKLPNQGIEKTKIIYRTRVIGQFNFVNGNNNQQQQSNGVTYNLSNSIFDWPIDSDEDDNMSDTDLNESQKTDLKKPELNDLEALKILHREMPINQHSTKKELRENNVKGEMMQSNDNLNNVKEPEPINNNDPIKKEINGFRKVNFVDSLELYRQQQLKKEQVLNEMRNQQKERAKLQRQNSFYIKNRSDNVLNTIEEETTSKNIDPVEKQGQNQQPQTPQQQPVAGSRVVPLIVVPARNHINNINIKEQYNENSYSAIDKMFKFDQPQPIQFNSRSSPVMQQRQIPISPDLQTWYHVHSHSRPMPNINLLPNSAPTMQSGQSPFQIFHQHLQRQADPIFHLNSQPQAQPQVQSQPQSQAQPNSHPYIRLQEAFNAIQKQDWIRNVLLKKINEAHMLAQLRGAQLRAEQLRKDQQQQDQQQQPPPPPPPPAL